MWNNLIGCVSVDKCGVGEWRGFCGRWVSGGRWLMRCEWSFVGGDEWQSGDVVSRGMSSEEGH